MRKNGNMFEWAIEVAVVVAIVLLLMGVCFWAVPHLQKTDRSTSPTFSVFDVEDAQSKGEAFRNPTIWLAVSTM